MKQFTFLSLLAGILFLPVYSLAQYGNTDQEAIRKTIEDETKAWQQCNYDLWTDYWWHEDNSYFSVTGPDSHWSKKGWEEFSTWVKAKLSDCTPSDADLKRRDYQYAINGNMSFVTFLEGEGVECTCFLEKRDGRWKIIRWVDIMTPQYREVERRKQLEKQLGQMTGKWEADLSTEKSDPPERNGWEVLDAYCEIGTTETGYLLSYWVDFKKDGGMHKYSYMELAADTGNEDMEVFLVQNSSYMNRVFVMDGTARMAEDGTLTALAKDPKDDKLVKTYSFSMNSNGRLYVTWETHCAGQVLNRNSIEMVNSKSAAGDNHNSLISKK